MVAQPTTDPAIRDELQRDTTTPLQSNFFLISNLKVGIGYLEPVKKKNHPDREYTANSYSYQKPYMNKGRRFN